MSDTTNEPLLELDGIGKFYGNIIALQGITTEVRAGEVTGEDLADPRFETHVRAILKKHCFRLL